MLHPAEAKRLFAIAPKLAAERYSRREEAHVVSVRRGKQWLEFQKKAKEKVR